MFRIIIVLPLMLLLLFVILSQIRKVTVGKRLRLWFIWIYCATLLISAIIYPFLSSDKLLDEQIFSNIVMEDDDSHSRFYELISEGRVSDGEGISVIKEWLFETEQKEIIINRHFNGIIFLERKDDLDGNINIVHHVGEYRVYGIDLKHLIEPPNVNLIDNQLVINNSTNEVNLEYVLFNKEVILSQFGESSLNDLSYGRYLDEQAIVIQIPTDIEVVDDEYIEYIGEAE